MRNELIGMSTAFAAAALLVMSNLMKIPYLMIPGFILWAFSAGHTGYQVYKSSKKGKGTYYIRVFLLLAIGILMFIFVRPKA